MLVCITHAEVGIYYAYVSMGGSAVCLWRQAFMDAFGKNDPC